MAEPSQAKLRINLSARAGPFMYTCLGTTRFVRALTQDPYFLWDDNLGEKGNTTQIGDIVEGASANELIVRCKDTKDFSAMLCNIQSWCAQ